MPKNRLVIASAYLPLCDHEIFLKLHDFCHIYHQEDNQIKKTEFLAVCDISHCADSKEMNSVPGHCCSILSKEVKYGLKKWAKRMTLHHSGLRLRLLLTRFLWQNYHWHGSCSLRFVYLNKHLKLSIGKSCISLNHHFNIIFLFILFSLAIDMGYCLSIFSYLKISLSMLLVENKTSLLSIIT